MKIAKRLLLILMSAIMMIGGGGCNMNNENNNVIQKEEPTLNEWQKEFLAEQKLPTEYSELSGGQRSSVKRIYG